MRVEDVPVQFSEETIKLAFTTWLMGAVALDTKDESVNADVIGQLFAIVVGRRIAIEGEGRSVGIVDLLRELAMRVKDQISAQEYAVIDACDIGSCDAYYAEIVSQAKGKGIDLDELAQALQNISVVRLYAKRFMKEP